MKFPEINFTPVSHPYPETTAAAISPLHEQPSAPGISPGLGESGLQPEYHPDGAGRK